MPFTGKDTTARCLFAPQDANSGSTSSFVTPPFLRANRGPARRLGVATWGAGAPGSFLLDVSLDGRGTEAATMPPK